MSSGFKSTAAPGTVYLVGAGPGDPELLTVRALRLMQTADVIFHDDLVPKEIVALANPMGLVMSVGKRCGAKRITQAGIHAAMIDAVRRGMSVVRLKSGDPLVFGRAGEELAALAAAGIRSEVVPGITAAFAAAAAAGSPLTDRRSAAKLIFVSGHQADAGRKAEREKKAIWDGPLPEDATLVVYMPGRNLGALADELMAGGLADSLPVIVISRAALADQEIARTTLNGLCTVVPGLSPTLVLLGRALAPLEAAPEDVIARADAALADSLTVSL